jgi:hypothetical protein
MAEPTNVPVPMEFKRSEDFLSRYANNVQFESSVWDLKLLFGQLQLPPGEPGFVQHHTAMTLPWLQIKILSLYLQLNLLIHEALNGKIVIPQSVMPQIQPPGEDLADPHARAVAEAVFSKFQQWLTE